jgi:hypothetical protein
MPFRESVVIGMFQRRRNSRPLGADKPRLLHELNAEIIAPGGAPLRPAWARGL